MSAGTAYGQEPIEGQGPFGNIKAQGFRVIDRGERVIFTGKAKMVIYSAKGATKNKGAAKTKK
jgi:lipopolysaccharide export system protein LptC